MTLKVTPRDRLILGVFSLLLFASCYAYYRWATAPASPRRSIQPTERALQRQRETKQPATDVTQAPLVVEEEGSSTALPKRDYRFIAERNIFQLPSEKPKGQRPRETTRSAPAPLPSPGSLSAPPPLPVTPPPPPTSPVTSPSQIPSRPPNLTATGIVRLGEETRVLLENTQTRDIAFVRVGESAFGYQVNSVGENYVEVKQGDMAYRLTLGEGKQERRILAPSGPSAVARPTGAPPPPPSPQTGRSDGERRERGSSDWVLRVVDRWNQMPEFVRNRILQRVGEFWQQLSPDQQQQILQRFREAGVNFTPPR